MAPQLTTRKGASLRALCLWMASAMRFFPEPLSPVMSTLTGVGAICATLSRICCMASERPRMAVSGGVRFCVRASCNSAGMRG